MSLRRLAGGGFDGTLVDAVTYDDGITFPDTPGVAMQLDPGALHPVANDVGSNWCNATIPYGLGDLGTPGAPNPPCL